MAVIALILIKCFADILRSCDVGFKDDDAHGDPRYWASPYSLHSFHRQQSVRAIKNRRLRTGEPRGHFENSSG